MVYYTVLWEVFMCTATVNSKHALLVMTESCPLSPCACYAQCMLCVAMILEHVPTYMHSGSFIPAVWNAEVLDRV